MRILLKKLKTKATITKNYFLILVHHHILLIFFYLFLNHFEKCLNSKKNYEYPSKYVLLRTFKNTPIFLFVEKDAPLKNGIEIVFKDNSLWSLSPIEKLQVYKGYKVKKNKGRQFNILTMNKISLRKKRKVEL